MIETDQKWKRLKTQRFSSKKVVRQMQTKQLLINESINKQLKLDFKVDQKQAENLQIPERQMKRTQLYIPLSATITFSMIREIIYFQRWNNIYPGDFLNKIVPFFCSIVHEDTLDHQEFVYFLLTSPKRKKKQQEIKDTKIENNCAILLEESFQPSKIITCLKVNRQMIEILDNVLNRVAFKQKQAGKSGNSETFAELFRTLSIQKKFWMLCEARRIILSYNQFLFKKGSRVESVFVTANGEFAEIQSKSIKRYFSHSKFFGFEQIISQVYSWRKSVISHANGTVAFQISEQLLLKYFNIRILNQKRLPPLNLPTFQRLSLNLSQKNSSHSGPASLDLLDKYCIHQKKFKILLKGNKEKIKRQTMHDELEDMISLKSKKSMKKISLKYKQFQKLIGSNDAIKEVFKDSYLVENMKRYSLLKEKQLTHNSQQKYHFTGNLVKPCVRRSMDSIPIKISPKYSNKYKHPFLKENHPNYQTITKSNPRDSSQIIMKRLRKMQKSRITLQSIKKGKYYIRA